MAIFERLADKALLEEARARLGKEALLALMGIAEDTLYSWRARATHRFTPEQRELLIAAIRKTEPVAPPDPMRAALDEIARELRERLDRIERRLAERDVPERKRRRR